MNTQTLTSWKALPLMFLLLAFSSVSMAGDKARSKLPTITGIAENTDGFEILYAALDAAGLADTFDGKRSYTVFAPTDKAFERLLEVNRLSAEDLLESNELVSVLSYHVTRGNRLSGSVVGAGALKMLDKNMTSISVTDSGPMIDDAVIVGPDLRARNGVIHVIDTVLLPPGSGLISAPPMR